MSRRQRPVSWEEGENTTTRPYMEETIDEPCIGPEPLPSSLTFSSWSNRDSIPHPQPQPEPPSQFQSSFAYSGPQRTSTSTTELAQLPWQQPWEVSHQAYGVTPTLPRPWEASHQTYDVTPTLPPPWEVSRQAYYVTPTLPPFIPYPLPSSSQQQQQGTTSYPSRQIYPASTTIVNVLLQSENSATVGPMGNDTGQLTIYRNFRSKPSFPPTCTPTEEELDACLDFKNRLRELYVSNTLPFYVQPEDPPRGSGYQRSQTGMEIENTTDQRGRTRTRPSWDWNAFWDWSTIDNEYKMEGYAETAKGQTLANISASQRVSGGGSGQRRAWKVNYKVVDQDEFVTSHPETDCEGNLIEGDHGLSEERTRRWKHEWIGG